MKSKKQLKKNTPDTLLLTVNEVSMQSPRTTRRLKVVFIATLACSVFVGSGMIFAKYGATFAWKQEYTAPETATNAFTQIQFPVSVNPIKEEIFENTSVDTFLTNHISERKDPTSAHVSWLGRALGKLALHNWYQNLASLTSRMLVIESGERKEQVADHFTKILGWNESERNEFLTQVIDAVPQIEEGTFFPGTYVVEKGATPSEVATLIMDRFEAEVLARYGDDVEALVPLKDTLTIASLLEREAYDFEDMRHISGVIWNRLFIDMKLQIDATLQYAKGSKPTEPWWPKVVPADKYLASVFNTYKNPGLPPAPIANPSLEAILAALNPRKTDCMYYFHDKNSQFHCAETYEEHVRLLKEYYGRGK